jgi:hypothetical protein
LKNFQLIAQSVDVLPLVLSIKQHPELWNQHALRKEHAGTPHTEMTDIWIRYRDEKDYDAADPKAFIGPHFPKWYEAYAVLPQLRPLIFSLMARMEATHLGGILITRIPPGGRIAAHTDKGWHPEFYNTKLYVVLETNQNVGFRVLNESVFMQTGDVWWIDNTKEHEIWNDGDTDRMTLIICMRRE